MKMRQKELKNCQRKRDRSEQQAKKIQYINNRVSKKEKQNNETELIFKMVILVLDNVEFKVKSRKLTGYYIMINSLFL